MMNLKGMPERSAGGRWLRKAVLATSLLGMAGGAWAAHDLVLQHSGPATVPVTGAAVYVVKLDNTDPSYGDTATGVQLTYEYDSSIVSLSGPAVFANGSGDCNDNGTGTITCGLADIPWGTDGLTVTFSFNVHGSSLNDNSFSSSVVHNPLATVASVDDAVPGNESEGWTTTILAGTDLGITLTTNPVSGNSVASGTIWTHEAEVVNKGPLSATNAKATIQLAAGAQWVGPLPARCEIVGSDVECTVPGTLASGDSVTFPGIPAQVTAANGSTLIATAVVTSDRTDQNAANNSASADLTVTPGTDLILGVSSSGGTILAGDPSTVTITPTYTGDVPDNPSFTVTIPSALTVDADSLTYPPTWGSCVLIGTALTCNGWNPTDSQAGANQPMGLVSFQVTGPAGSYNVGGTITSDSQEENLANNEDSTLVAFQTPTIDVTISKSGPSGDMRDFTIGSQITYTVTLTNPSSSNVGYWGELSFTENAPAGLTINNISGPDGWTCSIGGCSRTYTQDSPFPRNSSQRFTVTATVTSEDGLEQTNRVCRTAFTHPLVGTVNGESCTSAGSVTGHPVANGTDLSTVKSVTTASGDIKAGDWLAYRIELANPGAASGTGSVAAVNARLDDNLSDLLTVPGSPPGDGSFQITAIPAGWTCRNGSGDPLTANQYLNLATVNLNCQIASFAACTAGSGCPVVEFRIRPRGQNNNGNNLSRHNTATITSDTPEPSYANNTRTVSSDVQAKADFTIAKEVTSWNDKTGTELQYTVTVTNLRGSSGANNVIVTDVLPLNVTYLGLSGADVPGSCSGPAVGETTAESNRTLQCSWDTFPRNSAADGADSNAVRSFIVRIRPNNEWQGGRLVNDVYVNVDPAGNPLLGTTEESDYGNNHAQAEATAEESDIDLQVTKVDRTDPVMVGQDVVYELRIINHGPSVATNASIYDYLPVGGFGWVGNVQFWDVVSGSLVEIADPAAAGISCSRQPDAGDHGTGGQDGNDPDKLDWLWPMNPNALDPSDPAYNPAYVNGEWDTRIADNADIICNMGLLESGQVRALTYTLKATERGVYLNHAIVRSQEHIDRLANGFTDANWNNDVAQHRTTVRSVPDVALEKEVSQPEVSLREPFSYTITVRNDHTLQNADFPEVRDSLPANIELTGTPTLLSGTLAGGDFACWPDSAVEPEDRVPSQAGDTAFACSLGEGVPPASTVVIEVPVRVAAGSVATLTNTAFLHLDTDLEFDTGEPPPWDQDEVNVDVVVSSISGYVYHDIGNDGVRNSEPPIAGVTIRLTGTEDDSGNSVSREMQTDANGYYEFGDLAPGIYTIEEVHPSNWVDGKDTVGLFAPDEPGTGVAGDDVIGGIVLPADTHGIEYNFGEVKELPAGEEAASVSGYVYHDRADDGVRGDNPPIPYVEIVLSWEEGGETQTQTRTTVTDDSGYYYFGGLEPGVTYTITEVQPEGWRDGKETVGEGFGSGGESPENDVFVVTPGSGEEGIEFNFGELRPLPTAIPVNNPWALLLLMLVIMGTMARSRMRR